jgi:PAS domain-containing protein
VTRAGLTPAAGEVPHDALDLVIEAAAHLSAPCYLYDLQSGHITWANPAFVSAFGLDEGSRIPPCIEEIAHPADTQLLAERTRRLGAARDGEILVTVCRLWTGGEWRMHGLQEAVLARSVNGAPHVILGLARVKAGDRPDRGNREEELELERVLRLSVGSRTLLAAEQEQRRLFETALAHIPLATAILDSKTLCVRWANHAFADFVEEPFRGLSIEGRCLEQVMPHVAASGLAEIMRKVASTGRPCADLRYVYRGSQYGARYWRFSLQPLPGEGGELMLHIEDVTGMVRGQPAAAGMGQGVPMHLKS